MKHVLLFLCCCFLLIPRPVPASDLRFSPQSNKANLILWREWGQDALDEAKTQDKLVLLSLSAIWCHWCHVMDETTYSNEEIIAFINEHFIPIRVDSDMRPDIDALYNQGGWPSTVIMTPLGEVLTGGTYIPPDEMLGRVKRIADIFQNDRGTITGWLAETKAAIAQRELSEGEAATPAAPGEKELRAIVKVLAEAFDEKHGGFGSGQKFPNPESIDYLHAQRDEVRPGASFDIGMITEHIYVGDPGWDTPKYALTGSGDRIAESLNEYGAMGVSHLQLRFASRSINELCDQMSRFGAEVGPNLSR